jgi:hypothetical protein
MAMEFQDYVQGLQMLGGILALPRSLQYQQQEAEAHRKMLEGTGIDPSEVQSMYPDAPMHWLQAGDQGVGGKILGGVGDVGALLSTIAGKPIGPPRASVTELASAAKLRKGVQKDKAESALSAAITAGPQSKANGQMETGAEFQRRIASMGVGAGSVDRSLQGFFGIDKSQAWHGTPGERVQLTTDAEHAARAAQRPALIAAGNKPDAVDRDG